MDSLRAALQARQGNGASAKSDGPSQGYDAPMQRMANAAQEAKARQGRKPQPKAFDELDSNGDGVVSCSIPRLHLSLASCRLIDQNSLLECSVTCRRTEISRSSAGRLADLRWIPAARIVPLRLPGQLAVDLAPGSARLEGESGTNRK